MNTELRPLPDTYAAIVFKGECLEPEIITSILDVNPTLSYKRGDLYSIKNRKLERKFGLWIYSTKNKVHSNSLKRHLEALEKVILGDLSPWPNKSLPKIRELLQNSGIEFRVDVYWYGSAESKFPEISRSFLYAVREAGGSVETDFHRDGEEIAAA